MNLKKRLLALALVLPLMNPSPLRAQSGSSSIQGTVADASGAVVPGAEVVLTNTSTGVVLEGEHGWVGKLFVPFRTAGCVFPSGIEGRLRLVQDFAIQCDCGPACYRERDSQCCRFVRRGRGGSERSVEFAGHAIE